MKPKIVYPSILLVLVLALAWYNHQYHCYSYPFLTTPSGLSYKAIGKKGSGRKVKDNEWITFSILMKALDKTGQEKKEIIPKSEPFLLQFDQSFQEKNKPIAEMIRMIEANQRMVFKCSPAYYFQEENIESLENILNKVDLSKEDLFVTDIKLHNIMNDEEYNQMLEKRRQMLEKRRAEQLTKDKQLITDYLAKHAIKASSTDSGLFYIIDQSSDGASVVKHATVKVHYTGRLLDGSIFDTSLEEVAKANNIHNPKRSYDPLAFSVGVGCVIQGWDEGLLLLKKGEKARFFIPSTLAYGQGGAGDRIPANAILLFEVEVIDVCDPNVPDSANYQSNKPKLNKSQSNKSKSN